MSNLKIIKFFKLCDYTQSLGKERGFHFIRDIIGTYTILFAYTVLVHTKAVPTNARSVT